MVRAWGILVALLLALAASPVAARPPDAGAAHFPQPRGALYHGKEFSLRYDCMAYGGLDTTFAEVAADPERWDCSHGRPQMKPDKTFFRFTIAPGERMPHFFLSRRSVFKSISFMAVDADGATRSTSLPFSAIKPAHLGYMFKVPLPPVSEKTRTIYAAIALPTQRIMLEQAMVAPQGPGHNPNSNKPLFLIAALCGMLMMPLVFNFAFYRVLRQPFLLWHVAMTLTVLILTMISSGLITELVEVSPGAISALTVLSFSAFVATGGMFAYCYLEPDRLNPLLRRLMLVFAAWSMLIGIVHAVFPFVLRSIQSDLYYAAYVPVEFFYVVGLADALRRGSRAARFQLVGWVPILLLGMIRLVTHLLPFGPATDAMDLFYFAIALDVLATTMGVADRFMAIKRERDRAEAQARVMEGISERDALTGLLNRRAIEPRFAELHSEGFETLAVLDLDHFKSINDDFGHGKGDDVLKAAAAAMTPDKHTLAMRLGGEEFLLLLRGKDAIRCAEQRRQAISTRVASEVEGLDRLVTASMGVVTIPPEAMPDALFADLYGRADRLLYEAKQAGRNRMVNERMTAFAPRRKDRRRGHRRRKPRAA